MDTLLLGVTVVSLVVALVMTVSAWRLQREDKRRAAARVAALSAAAGVGPAVGPAKAGLYDAGLYDAGRDDIDGVAPRRAPWAKAQVPQPAEAVRDESARDVAESHPFLGTAGATQASGGRQRVLAIAAAVLFVILSLGVAWTMSGPRGTTARAMGPNNPLELVSLRHDRQATKLAISGLVRNPLTGKPVDHLSAVVFLFDQAGTFVTSARAPVDFVRLGVGDETPFVVSLDAPATVTRYRVSFRTDDGVVPHIDRRGAPPVAETGEQPVSVTLK